MITVKTDEFAAAVADATEDGAGFHLVDLTELLMDAVTETNDDD